MSIFVKNIQKYHFLSKFFENIDFSENCRKISSLVKFVKKISIFDKIVENSRCWSKFTKMSIWSKDKIILILVNISKKTSILDKTFENIDFRKNFQKILILVKFVEISRFWSTFNKMSILVKM